MRERLTALVDELRARGVRVSVAEAIDAAQAAAVVGVERARLRDALAAVLVKDEADRTLFEDAFARALPARAGAATRARTRSQRRRGAAGGGDGAGRAGATGGGTEGAAASARAGAMEQAGRGRSPAARPDAAAAPPPHPAPGALAAPDDTRPPGKHRPGARAGVEQRAHARAGDERRPGARAADEDRARDRGGDGIRDAAPGSGVARERALARQARARALLAAPLRSLSAADLVAAEAVVAALARRFEGRLRRRRRPRARGRLDVRRTLRAAVTRGGVAFERRYRGRRRAPVSLVALVDLSASAATATGLFLALLAPAARHFGRVRLFGFVDRLVEIEFVDRQVRPAGPIDLMARSDFGRVLADLLASDGPALGADTVLLVLGDARNNRRPPRADLLARARARVRRVLWLNPESAARWDTGDSVIASYARHADAVVPCGSLAELDRALAAVARL